MPSVSMRQMLEAGVHFGHQTRFWNPKMAPFIFGERNKIHIINLEKTQPLYAQAAAFIKGVAAEGGKVLFVGTKRSARDAVQKEAMRCSMPYVNQRWLGGMLTNFKTIRQSIKRLNELDEMAQSGCARPPRQERGADAAPGNGQAAAQPGRHPRHERAARCVVRDRRRPRGNRDPRGAKARHSRWSRWSTPIARPDGIDYVIPGNDDAMRAILLYAGGIADSVLEGKASLPEVPVGEDEFVELDEEGNPKKRVGGRAPAAGRLPARQEAAAAPQGSRDRDPGSAPPPWLPRTRSKSKPTRCDAVGRRHRAETPARAAPPRRLTPGAANAGAAALWYSTDKETANGCSES